MGKYIVIEGLEGAGKTTARNVVVETLKSLGINSAVWCWILNLSAKKLSPIKRKS